MALLNPYCTVQQVKDYLRNQDSAITTQLESAINAASRWIDRYKGRDYYLHDYSSVPLVIDKWDRAIVDEFLFLPYCPIITLTAVTVAGVVQVEGTDFKRKSGSLVFLTGTWPEAILDADAVSITGKFGYDQTANTAVPTGMPEPITQACVQVAAAISKYNLKDVITLDGGKTSLLDTDIPKSAKELLGGRARLIL
jgi:hypothetical protein